VETVVGSRSKWQVRYEFVGTDIILGKRVDRILVTCIPRGALSIGEIMGASQSEVKCTIAVVASLISSQDVGKLDPQGDAGATVAIGLYGDRIEVSVHEKGSLRFAGFLDHADSGTSMSRLESLVTSASAGKPQISRVVLYGHRSDTWDGGKEGVFSQAPFEWLQPRSIFGPNSRRITTDSAFAPVAAGAFNRLLSNV